MHEGWAILCCAIFLQSQTKKSQNNPMHSRTPFDRTGVFQQCRDDIRDRDQVDPSGKTPAG